MYPYTNTLTVLNFQMMLNDENYLPVGPSHYLEDTFTQSDLLRQFNIAFYEAQNIAIEPDYSNMCNQIDQKVKGNEENVSFLDLNLDHYVDSSSIIDLNFPRYNDNFRSYDLIDCFEERIEDENIIQYLNDEFSEDGIIIDEMIDSTNIHELDLNTIDSECPSIDTLDLAYSSSSGDLNHINSGIQFLPAVGTITKNNLDFNNFLRTVPDNDIGYLSEVRLFSL